MKHGIVRAIRSYVLDDEVNRNGLSNRNIATKREIVDNFTPGARCSHNSTDRRAPPHGGLNHTAQVTQGVLF